MERAYNHSIKGKVTDYMVPLYRVCYKGYKLTEPMRLCEAMKKIERLRGVLLGIYLEREPDAG
jgi:hypothetical protein